jgi:hypothetical protein
MTRLPIYTDIAGVEGREPIGAVLTVGTRASSNANPTDRDAFFIKSPKVNGQGIRPNHPAFDRFNGAPKEARRSVTCVAVHARREEWCTCGLINYAMPGVSAPDGRPWCIGDGVEATRWDAQSSKHITIPCPHDRCQYRQETRDAKGRAKRDCKPITRVLFQPVWKPGADGRPALPTPLMEFDTHSWFSTSNAIGMIQHVERQSEMLGVPRNMLSWYGFRFTMTLTDQKQASKGRNFPVVLFSPDMQVQDFILSQAATRGQIASAYTERASLALPESLPPIADTVAALAGPRED